MNFFAKPAYLIIPIALLCACTSNNEFEISGEIKNQQGKTIYLQKFVDNRPVTIDSAIIEDNGSFEITNKLPNTDFYQLVLGEGNTFVFVGDTIGELYLEAEGNINIPKKIEGSLDTKLLLDFEKNFNALMLKRDSIGKLMQSGTPEMQVMQLLNDFNKNALDYIHTFVNTNSSSPAVFAALSKLDPVRDMSYFKKVLSDVKPRMEKSLYYDFLGKQITQAAQQADVMRMQEERIAKSDELLAIGNEAPEISLPDPKGNIKSLKALRGKVVLIDFWASWCKPCRLENPNVVKAYKAFKGKGFEIFSVSLDKNQIAWENAIKEDGLTWTHVSDLQFWNSAAAQTYGVAGIPFAVLIDKEGKIIAKNLRGPALEAKLKEVL